MNNNTGIYVRLHKQNDKEILERLNKLTNKNGYIKAVIRNDALIYKQYEKGEEKHG